MVGIFIPRKNLGLKIFKTTLLTFSICALVFYAYLYISSDPSTVKSFIGFLLPEKTSEEIREKYGATSQCIYEGKTYYKVPVAGCIEGCTDLYNSKGIKVDSYASWGGGYDPREWQNGIGDKCIEN